MKISFAVLMVLLLVCLQPVITSCNHSDSPGVLPGTWSKLDDFTGEARSGAVSFVINGNAFVGGGYNFASNKWLSDFWRYDPLNDKWEKVADFPGIPRSNAVAFVLNNKGYVGSGTGDGHTGLSDFYEFDASVTDPSTNTIGQWKKTADCPASRYGGIGFAVKGRAFIGSGIDAGGNSLKDLWEYDQAGNAWIQRPDMGGVKRAYGFVMIINDYAYVGGGIDDGQVTNDFYRFDADAINSGSAWTAMNSLTGKDDKGKPIAQPKSRASAAAFAIGDFGYLACGSYSAGLTGVSSDLWQYDPSKDSWFQCSSFALSSPVSGAARNSTVSFVLTASSGQYGFLATGGNPVIQFDDTWKFDPKRK